jgi:hypothetical protein
MPTATTPRHRAPAPSTGPKHARPAASARARAGQAATKGAIGAGRIAAKGAGAAGGKAKGSAKAAVRNPGENVLMAEYMLCMIILGAGTLVAPSGSKDGVPRLMIKASALSILFVVLALVSAGGPRLAKVAGAAGGLITLAYVVVSSDAHDIVKWISSFYSTKGVAGS